jgi:pimeloyl-ACP methyl ester carboxylesterase
MTQFSTRYHTVSIDGLDVFYRQAGEPANPTLLLLHGFPSSSHMFRNLISALADDFIWWRPIISASGVRRCPG